MHVEHILLAPNQVPAKGDRFRPEFTDAETAAEDGDELDDEDRTEVWSEPDDLLFKNESYECI